MLALQRFRSLLGNEAKQLSEEDLRRLRDEMYAIAQAVIGQFSSTERGVTRKWERSGNGKTVLTRRKQ